MYLWVGIILMVALSCSDPKSRLAKLMSDPENGLTQTKQGKTRSILFQVLPRTNNQKASQAESVKEELYRVRLTLRAAEKVTGYEEMQYMNFGIRNSVYAVKGRDTLSCAFFERIPGISEREFLYLIAFDEPPTADKNDWDLRVYLRDTVGGWGKHQFEIKHTVLQKLNSIN